MVEIPSADGKSYAVLKSYTFEYDNHAVTRFKLYVVPDFSGPAEVSDTEALNAFCGITDDVGVDVKYSTDGKPYISIRDVYAKAQNIDPSSISNKFVMRLGVIVAKAGVQSHGKIEIQTIDGEFVKINWYKPSSYVAIYNIVCDVPM